jgi:hypothetical protein
MAVSIAYQEHFDPDRIDYCRTFPDLTTCMERGNGGTPRVCLKRTPKMERIYAQQK